jgi:hypothetical protein
MKQARRPAKPKKWGDFAAGQASGLARDSIRAKLNPLPVKRFAAPFSGASRRWVHVVVPMAALGGVAGGLQFYRQSRVDASRHRLI